MISNSFLNTISLNRIVEQTTSSRISRIERVQDYGFNLISGAPVDHLNPVQHRTMGEDCYFQWLKNPLANSIIEIFYDFVVGDGITTDANDDRVKECLDQYFYHPKNDWDNPEGGARRIRDWSLYGESILKPFVSDYMGNVKISSIYPGYVSKVHLNPEDSEEVEYIEETKGINSQKHSVIRFDEKSQTYQGDVFYFKLNATMHQSRGVSDLYSTRDWLNLYDKSLFATMDRVGLLLSFVWDITIKGATEEQIRKKFNQLRQNPPKPGGVRVHNEDETWSAENPDLRGRELSDVFHLLKSQIIGGSREPEHFFGMGGNVNRATALEMNPPFFKKVKRRQKAVRYYFRTQFDYVIHHKIKTGQLKGVKDFNYAVNMPEPDTQIATNLSDSIFKYSQSLVLLEQNGFINHDTGVAVVDMLLNQFGIEVSEIDDEGDRTTESMYNAVKRYMHINAKKKKSKICK